MIVRGGKTDYGQDIGILMLDTIFPRIVGDIGNAATFPFPVKYKVVKGVLPTAVVEKRGEGLLPYFLAAACELEAEGVRAITTSCGFLAVFQQELSAAVRVPVFTSSLLQIPLVARLLPPGQKIVVVTANSRALSPRHLQAAGVERERLAILGLEEQPEFYSVFVQQKPVLDVAKVAAELREVAAIVRDSLPEAGAIVCECTNLPPFRAIFQKVTGLPVFDIVTLVKYIRSSLP